MDYASYVKGISFRFLPPSKSRPKGFRALNGLLRRIGVQLEVANTRLPCDVRETKRRLRDVCRVPRMSTFAIGAMINRAVAQMPKNQAFVNVGVWNGFTFFSGLSGNSHKICIGVDNFSHKDSPKSAFFSRFEKFAGKQHSFHERDYREYFAHVHTEPIGFYLFDGPHAYADQLDGLRLAEPFFAENCIVMVDDCNWDQVRGANLDFMAESPNKWRILLDERTPKSGHPTYWNGLMIFQMVGPNKLAKGKEPGQGKKKSKAA